MALHAGELHCGSASEKFAEPLMKPSQMPGSFRVKSLLGGKSGGTSFLAEDGTARRPRWVLRWLPWRGSGSLREQLRKDIGDLASLSHPALALPVAFGIEAETKRAYLLRPYIEGSDILMALQGKAPADLIPWMGAATEALSILHRAGVSHGNLKTSNVLVPKGALFARTLRGPRVVLCDPACWPAESSPGVISSDLA